MFGQRPWFSQWVKSPFQFFAFSGSAWLFFHYARLPGWEGYAAALVAAAALGGLVHVAVSFLFTVSFSRRRDIHLPPLLRNVILGGTYLIILVVALKASVPGFSLSPLLLASGVLSLVLGLALQDVLSNLIAGITISVERPLRKDDWVTIGDKHGKVAEITWRTTKLLTRQLDYVVIPNRKVAESELLNHSYPVPLHGERVDVGLPYSTLPTIAEEALLEAASQVQGVLSNPGPSVVLRGFGDSSVDYGLCVCVEDYDNLGGILSDLRKEIFYSLRRYGVTFPFPTRTLQVYPGPPAPAGWKESYRHRLHALEGARSGEFFPLGEEPVRLGRGEESCEIDLRDLAISKEHARISCQDGEYFLEDLASRHGTFVNGKKAERAKLGSGDEIRIGESRLRFEKIELG